MSCVMSLLLWGCELEGNSSQMTQECLNILHNWATFKICILAIGHLFSVICLTLTFGVYFFVRDLRNLHGFFIMNYSMSLLAWHCCSLLSCLWPFMRMDISTGDICYWMGILNYFFMIASFYWINDMCINVCVSAVVQSRPKTSKPKYSLKVTYLIHFVYSWSGSAIITAVCASFNENPYRPSFLVANDASTSCWFFDTDILAIYLYLPIIVFIICNFLLFNYTGYRLRMIKRTRENNNQYNYDSTRFNMYIELFVMVALSWIMVMAMNLMRVDDMFSLFTNAFNSMLGVVVFIVLVCRKRVIMCILYEEKEKEYLKEPLKKGIIIC